MSKPKRIYVIAGEASGDLHASNLMRAVLEEDNSVDFRYWGGDKMMSVQEGCVKHIKDLAFMGFLEVIKNIRTILGNISFCKKDILAYKPDALLLVDYPGFNLRIAEWAKKNNIKVFYYISPQVWAWKQSRVHKIKKVVDEMYVILPFEKQFYKKFDFDVTFVGHPLIDEIERFNRLEKLDSQEFKEKNKLNSKPIIAVLPGSRKQEIAKKLPIMLDALSIYDDYQIIIAGAPSLDTSFYNEFLIENSKIIFGQTYNLLSHATAGVVTSGTATLETALFNVPEVVCYKSSKFSYEIAKRLIKIKFISLVNLIMDKEVVKELIQDDCSPAKIRQEMNKILNDKSYNDQMHNSYDELVKKLGSGGASKKVAQSLLKTI